MATVLDLSGLTEYIQVNRDELFVKSTMGTKSLDYIDLLPGVKGKEALNYLDSTVVLQDGKNCGFNPGGSDIFSQRYIEVTPVKIEKEWCHKDFFDTYAAYQLKWEAGRETLPFEQKIADSNMAVIQDAVEELIWQGNDDLGINGLIKDLDEVSASTVNFESGATASAKIDALVAALPIAMLKKGVNIYLSYTDFRNYIQEQNGACCANKPVVDAASESMKYFGDSRITIIPLVGLEGTGVIVAATKDALAYATDIENAHNTYRLWYDETDDVFRFRVLFMAGTAVRFPDEAVIGKEA